MNLTIVNEKEDMVIHSLRGDGGSREQTVLDFDIGHVISNEQIGELQQLFEEAGITDRKQLIAFVNGQNGLSMLANLDISEVVCQINELVSSARVPVKEKFDRKLGRWVTVLCDPPRDSVLFVAKLFWKKLFIPFVSGDETLENLVKRCIQVDKANGSCCVRRLTVDNGWSYKTEVTDSIICDHMKQICEKVCLALLEERVCTFLKEQSHLIEFAKDIAQGQKLLYIPQKLRKEIKKCIVADGKNRLVSAWHLIIDAADKQNNEKDRLPERKETKPDWLIAHEKRDDFRRSVPM